MQFIETSISDLYKSTIKAFPKTSLRQHAIDTVRVENLQWLPFLGVKTLFIKGLIRNENKKYDCLMLFKNIIFKENEGKKLIKIKMSDGRDYFVEQIISNKNDILVRCNCKDFEYRFNYYNHLDHSLYGRKRSKYEALERPDTANPKQMPGLCKHLIKMAKIVKETNLLV